MAEVVISAVAEGLLGKVVSLASEQISLAWGLKEALADLTQSLCQIRALLLDAEQKQATNPAVKHWLLKLKAVADDADAVLDKLSHEILRRKVEIGNQAKKKVLDFISHNSVAFKFKIAQQVKKVQESLDKIYKEAALLALIHKEGSVCVEVEETDSFLGDSQVIGRVDDGEKIVNLLIGSTSPQEHISVVSVVGMGGLGKTTLAKLVSNHEQVKKHFAETFWVCVSNNLDVTEIMRVILECLTKVPSAGNKDSILKSLQEKLGGRKYLLVLDDVWSEDRSKWEHLRHCLSVFSKNSGSKVVVTTRNDQVVSVIQEVLPGHKHRLGRLSPEECWSIIKEKVFGKEASVDPDFEAIGKAIAEKCGGIPLVASVLGGTMRVKKERCDWDLILHNKIWESLEDNNGVLRILKLSFDHLPSPLKQCFAYCSIFPKDFPFDREDLIQLWMAEGFLQPSQGSSILMEDIGSTYFKILLGNSLFQDVNKDDPTRVGFYNMHDLVHDLACSISESEIMTSEDTLIDINPHVRHLSFVSAGNTMPTFPTDGARKLLTLFSQSDVFSSISWKFKSLRVLKLGGARVSVLPTSIGQLKRLRYLDLSRTNISALPKSIGKLYLLETLRLQDCWFLVEIPEELKNLISLRHLYVDEKLMNQLPVEMVRLPCIQRLPAFVVNKEKGCGIEELECTNNLTGALEIHNLEQVRSGEEARKANLMGKTRLLELKFIWSSRTRREEDDNNDEEVLESLQIHPFVAKIKIYNYLGGKFPSWMLQLLSLVHIELRDCRNCEHIPTLGHLPRLKILRICGMKKVKCIGSDFYGIGDGGHNDMAMASFPALRYFDLQDMDNLVEWIQATTRSVVFPCLEELLIVNCPMLETVPSHFPVLVKLFLINVESHMPLLDLSSRASTLETLTIVNVSKLTTLPAQLLPNDTNLRSLSLRECHELKCIVASEDLQKHGWSWLSSLQYLHISNCENLQYLVCGMPMPATIRQVSVFGCHKLRSFPSMEGLSFLQSLVISNCEGLTSLPISLHSCSSLQFLTVKECPNLKNDWLDSTELQHIERLSINSGGRDMVLPQGLQRFTNLKKLGIGGFSRELDEFPSLTPIHHILMSLEDLALYGWSKLNSLPHTLQHLTALKSLKIKGFYGVETLPEWLGNLSSLIFLEIRNCQKLQCFPSTEAMRCLDKLNIVYIFYCPQLKKRCKANGGPEWSKISHVREIRILSSIH